MSSLALLACVQCLQMEPHFKESKKRLMLKIAGFAEKGEAANALECVRHTALLDITSVITATFVSCTIKHFGYVQ